MLNLDYITADIDSPFADRKIDITNIPFDDNTFDCAICVHILEHIIDDRKAIREIYRILKGGGWAIFQVPSDKNREKAFEDSTITDPKEREKFFGQWDHVCIPGRDYGSRLEEVDFKVKDVSFEKELEIKYLRRYGLTTNENFYYCLK